MAAGHAFVQLTTSLLLGTCSSLGFLLSHSWVCSSLTSSLSQSPWPASPLFCAGKRGGAPGFLPGLSVPLATASPQVIAIPLARTRAGTRGGPQRHLSLRPGITIDSVAQANSLGVILESFLPTSPVFYLQDILHI